LEKVETDPDIDRGDYYKQGASSPQELKEKSYEQKLRTMSTSELIQELATMKWHYALFRDKRKFEMACAVELEIARRKGSLEPSLSNGAKR
jgi:hypothetical protein